MTRDSQDHEVLPEPAASSSEKPNDEVLPEPAASSSAAAEVPKIYTQQEIDHFVKQLETMVGWGGKDDFTYITESGEIFCKKGPGRDYSSVRTIDPPVCAAEKKNCRAIASSSCRMCCFRLRLR